MFTANPKEIQQLEVNMAQFQANPSAYQPFLAMTQGMQGDYSTHVESNGGHDPAMLVCAAEGAIYITKAQAMEFFNLVEAPAAP